MRRIVYRIGQFWRGLSARVTPQERQRAAEILPPAALSLFLQMPTDAQRHSLNVLEGVKAAGYDHPDLWVAALLHDCGKVASARGGVALGLWLRGPLVLLDALLPRLVAAWASPQPAHGWRYALYVQRAHPTIGALWAAEAGCSELSCWLIKHHQTPLESIGEIDASDEARTLLMALQQADNDN
jgi:hypothetical protein